MDAVKMDATAGFKVPAAAGEKVGLIGGALAAIGASACCLGPLVLVSIGVGGASVSNLAALAPYRWIFILAALGFVGFAWHKIYRAPAVAQCEPGTVRRSVVRKRSLATSLALTAVLAVPLSAVAAEKTVTLSVPSMYCAACPITVRKALEKVPGVANVKATYEPKEAVVTFDDARTSIDKLTEATRNAGYPSSLKSGR